MDIKQCTSLNEVRSEVDKLDDEIVELIAKRNSYVKQAAAFKESIEEVKAPERMDAVMQRVRHKALSLNLSPNLISKLYTIMIDAMVESEISEFRNGGNF
ncbi:MAG: chorismate mutase [Thiovulaceae bacterium]|nr:chorismate mutase [Sulfurimonadaceae bacterium]